VNTCSGALPAGCSLNDVVDGLAVLSAQLHGFAGFVFYAVLFVLLVAVLSLGVSVAALVRR
jgi:hypothetical protein